MHSFLSNLVNRPTDKHGLKHVPPLALSEVITGTVQLTGIQQLYTSRSDTLAICNDLCSVYEERRNVIAHDYITVGLYVQF